MTTDLSCPVPSGAYERVVLGHGSGGRLSQELLARLFLPHLGNETLSSLEDAATLPVEISGGARLAVTTDGYVVRPAFFPGGDIGRLAVCGTINDLAVSGAAPMCLAGAFLLEEGFPLGDLERIVRSMSDTCASVGTPFVAGDTKVLDRKRGDEIFIVTTGIGIVPAGRSLSIHAARPGDRIVVSGTLGDHGIAVMAAREGLELETELASDCAPVLDLVKAVLAASPGVRCMRDPTRGGLAATLHELAGASRVGVRIQEADIPVRPEVRGACEILGLDPLFIASEGRIVAVVPPEDADAVVAALRCLPSGSTAAVVGEVASEEPGVVSAASALGVWRLVPLPAGELLPRIC
ncbi:MAG: hydrogenase expression/formation protein HypE [Acidobacteriota bacterium]